ncbi:MAG: AhpC/TSA family protein [Muribaculum sp.]|nr:AhpC/TSA family protein [Muribaculum sp.]
MNKRIVLSCVLTAAVLSAGAIDYVVEGQMPNADGLTIYLKDYDTDTNIDSTLVASGKFRMEGEYSRNAFARVEAGYNYANCVLDTLVVVDFNTHMPREGCSALNDSILAILKFEDAINSKLTGYARQIQSQGFNQEKTGDLYKNFYHKLRPQILDYYSDVIGKNPNGIGEMAVIHLMDWMLTPDEWDSIYQRMPTEIKGRNISQELNNRYATLRRTMPGMPFIDFSGKTPEGKDVRFSDYIGHGKYVLVDFWASWCGPCRAEAKNVLIPLYERLKDNDKFEILGVGVWDNPEETNKAIKTLGYNWPQIIDTGTTPMELYGFNAIPMIMLFSPDGKILARQLRGDNLVNEVDKALGLGNE